MTLVWRTLRGGRFHRDASCTGISDGHARAASEGKSIYPAEQCELVDIGAEVTPCQVCWGHAMREDRWLASQLKTEAKADSTYEIDFYEGVLKRVTPAIDPDYLHVQHEAHGASGRLYRVDFAYLQPGYPHLAIEIDGFQKDKSRNEADEARMGTMKARENDLVNAGWRLLRFTNGQVTTQAGLCRSSIEMYLRDQKMATPDSSRHAPSPSTAQPRQAAEPVRDRPSRLPWVAAGVVGLLIAVGLVWILAMSIRKGDDSASVPPRGDSCPSAHPVKANQSGIYHEPGWQYYDRTTPEECFATGEDAQEAGYRASEVQ